MQDAAAKKIVGLTVAALVKETLEKTQKQIARDAGAGELSRRFDMAMQIARERGMPEDRARDVALATVLEGQAERMLQNMLQDTITILDSVRKREADAPRVQIIESAK